MTFGRGSKSGAMKRSVHVDATKLSCEITFVHTGKILISTGTSFILIYTSSRRSGIVAAVDP